MSRPKAYSYTRMSTVEQLKGDSRRRQIALTEKYAEEKGLEISARFDDWGVSAYRGRNVKIGSLGRFKESIASGEVERGSYLIVESMDRLSRQDVPTALTHLLSIIADGIIVVTLDDRREYSSDTLKVDPWGLMMALGGMARAHEESRRKAGLLSSVWEEKKRKARIDGTVLTSKVPGWLRVDPDTKKVVEIPERSVIVQEIFTLVRDGWGAYSVSRHLNERGEKPWSKRRNAVWRESYIKKIIASRTVLGEYQPHRIIHDPDADKARVPDGDPLIAYYPAVVTESLFREAAMAMSRRRTAGRGRKGARYANLFTGMLRCQCTAGYRYIDKGAPPKGGQYLQCSVSHQKGRCEVRPFRYQAVEEVLLSVIESLDVARVLGGETIHARLAEKRHLLGDAQEEAQVLEKRIKRVMDTIMSDSAVSPATLKGQLVKIEREQEKNNAASETLQREIDELLEIDPLKRKEVISRLLSTIRATDGTPQNEMTRRALVAELQRMIETIQIVPNVRLAWEAMDEDPDWKKIYKVRSQVGLDRLFREYGFALNIVYRSGDLQYVDGLDGAILKLRGNPKQKRLMFVAGSPEGPQQ